MARKQSKSKAQGTMSSITVERGAVLRTTPGAFLYLKGKLAKAIAGQQSSVSVKNGASVTGEAGSQCFIEQNGAGIGLQGSVMNCRGGIVHAYAGCEVHGSSGVIYLYAGSIGHIYPGAFVYVYAGAKAHLHGGAEAVVFDGAQVEFHGFNHVNGEQD